MRKLIGSLVLCCCATVGYSDHGSGYNTEEAEVAQATEATTEVSKEVASADESSQEAAPTESHNCQKSKGGCGCGTKPKM